MTFRRPLALRDISISLEITFISYISRNCLTLERSMDQEIVNVSFQVLYFLQGCWSKSKGEKDPPEVFKDVTRRRLFTSSRWDWQGTYIIRQLQLPFNLKRFNTANCFWFSLHKLFAKFFSGTGQRGRVWWWWRRHDCLTTLQVSIHAVIQNQVY